jgi:hypothetical protein
MEMLPQTLKIKHLKLISLPSPLPFAQIVKDNKQNASTHYKYCSSYGKIYHGIYLFLLAV